MQLSIRSPCFMPTHWVRLKAELVLMIKVIWIRQKGSACNCRERALFRADHASYHRPYGLKAWWCVDESY